MGQRGPKPKPTALKVFTGVRLQNPADRSSEPNPGSGTHVPDPPDWLGEKGREEWRTTAPILHAVGCLTEADQAMFSQYCSAWDDFHAANEKVKADGINAWSSNGNPMVNPAVKTKHLAMAMIVKIGSMFGLNPSSRVGLTAAPHDVGANDLDDFKNGRAPA